MKERNKGEVLIVSNTEGWGSTLASQLGEHGYFAYQCEDPEEVRMYLEYVYTRDQYNPPRLVLVEVDGKSISATQREFLAFLIEKSRLSQTPVLVWDHSDAHPEPLYELGVNAVLSPAAGQTADETARTVIHFWLDISVHKQPRMTRYLPQSGITSGSMM